MVSRSDLTKLPAFDRESSCWHAVIETPQGSPHKYSFAPKLRCFELKKTLPQGMTFPLDFGFIPSTLGEDGDPLDVMVLLDFPALMGALVKVRLIGGIQAKQKERGEEWIRNDRLIAVAAHSQTLAAIKSLGDLRPEQLDQLIEFFKQYLKLEGKQLQPLENCDAKQAAALIEIGIKKFKKSK